MMTTREPFRNYSICHQKFKMIHKKSECNAPDKKIYKHLLENFEGKTFLQDYFPPILETL